MTFLERAIADVRRVATELENATPFSIHDSPMEEAAHELYHALVDAAGIAERSMKGKP